MVLVSQPQSGHVSHTVLFWFKPDQADAMAAAVHAFYLEWVPGVAGVEQLFVGRPLGTAREVVDNSYHLMSFTRFRDRDAADAWQRDPVHDKLRTLLGPGLDRVQVYDNRE